MLAYSIDSMFGVGKKFFFGYWLTLVFSMVIVARVWVKSWTLLSCSAFLLSSYREEREREREKERSTLIHILCTAHSFIAIVYNVYKHVSIYQAWQYSQPSTLWPPFMIVMIIQPILLCNNSWLYRVKRAQQTAYEYRETGDSSLYLLVLFGSHLFEKASAPVSTIALQSMHRWHWWGFWQDAIKEVMCQSRD